MNAAPRKIENPRTVRVRQIIVNSAAGLLIKEGAGAVTAVRVAENSGVARTTIYRHWPEPKALLLDAIDCVVKPHIATKITDNLEADLTEALTNLQKRMRTKPFRIIFTALLDNANQDPDLVAAQRRFVNGILKPVQDVIIAARQRGDLPSSARVETASVHLAGPLFLQHVMLRGTVSEQLITETITQFLCSVRDGRDK